MIQVCGSDWKIPYIYRQPLDMVVTSFEETLGREDFLPMQHLMLAPGMGGSRATGRAHARQLGVLQGPGRRRACSAARAASTLGCWP